MLKPVMEKRFWFYNDWNGGFSRGGDEWGHHTVVIPLGKERALVVAWRSGYKWPFKCAECVESREQYLLYEQENLYIQTYWNVEEFDDILDLSNDQWNEALGVPTNKGSK